jgi:hypothetical protein
MVQKISFFFEFSLTRNSQCSICSLSNDIHPKDAQESNANNGGWTNQQCQTKQECRQEHVIQIEKTTIVLDTSQKECGRLLDVKGALFSSSKINGNASQAVPIEQLLGSYGNVFFGALGKGCGGTGNGIIGAGSVPLSLLKETKNSEYECK